MGIEITISFTKIIGTYLEDNNLSCLCGVLLIASSFSLDMYKDIGHIKYCIAYAKQLHVAEETSHNTVGRYD